MSLRKSPTLTPALLAANRRNAQKSTGPRTERGKNWSRVNRLKTGRRSPIYQRFTDAILAAMPGEVRRAAEATVPPYLAEHPLYLDFLDGILETDRQLGAEYAARRTQPNRLMKTTFQAGMLFKPKEGGIVTKAETTGAPCDPRESQAKTTFQAGMSLKTNAGVSSELGRLCGGDTKTALPNRPPVGWDLNGEATFQPGISLKTDEFEPDECSDQNIDRVTEIARRMGMPKAFFDWADREIRAKKCVPTRNVDEKKEGV